MADADPDVTRPGVADVALLGIASCPVAHVRTTDFSGSVFVCLRPSGPRTVACHFPDGSLRI